MKFLSALVLLASHVFGAGTAAEYAQALQTAGLDPDECYRVRDLSVTRDELRVYLTDGYLIFAKPAAGRRNFAVFTADVEGGDAEVLITPPTRSERLSLASFTNTPNLSEHFTNAVFVFTDKTGDEMAEQIKTSSAKKSAEFGVILAEKWTPVTKSFTSSFEIRLVQDHFRQEAQDSGFFYVAASGKVLGNFDAIFDPRAREQIVVGQVAFRDDRRYFDVWTSFISRSVRNRRRLVHTNKLQLQRVSIDATLGDQLRLSATTKIKFNLVHAPERALAFELSRRMQVSAVRVDGVPVEFFARDSMRASLLRGGENDVFLVMLPENVAPGEHEIEFEHAGNVIASSGNGVYYVGARDTWFPNAGPAFAHFDLTFRFPKELDLVSTGELVEERTEGDLKIVRRSTTTPVRFAGFNLGDYEKASAQKGGYKVDVYANRRVEAALQPKPQAVVVMPERFPRPRAPRQPEVLHMPTIPPDPTARLQTLAAEIGSSLESMSAWFGPAPFKTLTVAPIPGTFGQGFPGLVYLSTLSYLEPRDRPSLIRSEVQHLFFSELLYAHEVAHQWWGNVVTSASYQDDWLMEALANYSALMHLEKRKGRRALDTVLEGYREHLLTKTDGGRTLESAGPIIWGPRLSSSQTPGAWRAITYEKGSWIMHMLRGRLGDEAFIRMLTELSRRYRYQSLNTEQFRALAAEFAGSFKADPKLESFFDQWVYSTGIPTLKLEYKVQGRAPKLRVQGSVAQSDADESFSALVPVVASLPGRRSVTHWVATSSEPAPFTLNLAAIPVRVQLDPNNTTLMIRK